MKQFLSSSSTTKPGGDAARTKETATTATTVTSPSHSLQKVKNLLSVRNAAEVAVASTCSMFATLALDDIEEYIRLSRQLKNFEMSIATAEHVFFNTFLEELTRTEKVHVLFDMMDHVGTGIHMDKITDALQKIHGHTTNEIVKPMADMAMMKFSMGGTTAGFTRDNFDKFLEWLSQCMDCDLNDLLYLLVSRCAFSEDGRSILKNRVAERVSVNNKDDGLFEKAIFEARMFLIFQAMNFNGHEVVYFKDVAKHLYRFCATNMNSRQRKILLTIDSKSEQRTNFQEFVQLIQSITDVASTELGGFNEIANAMTLSICFQEVRDDDIMNLFLDHEACKGALSQTQTPVKSEVDDVLPYGKFVRLFDLVDFTKDGYLNTKEVTLFFRKYQSPEVDLNSTISVAVESIAVTDQDGDKQLNRMEFASLILLLARHAGIEVHRFIDFLVVKAALNDDDENDLKDVETYMNEQVEQTKGK